MMNKKILCFLIILLPFTGCKHPDTPQPEEPAVEEWATDSEYHWHDQSDFAPHEWKEEIVTQETEENEGKIKCVCSICGFEKTKIIPALVHTHTFEEAWTSDEYSHWHNPTCGHEDVVGNEENHNWQEDIIEVVTDTTPGEKKLTCTVCGFTKTEVIPDNAPDAVKNLSVIVESSKVSLSWKNPEDVDFEKVIISDGYSISLEVSGNPGENCSKTIYGLMNGREYKFSFKTVDANGNIGMASIITVSMNGGIMGTSVHEPGDVIESLKIGGNEISKTSEVYIVPEGTTAEITMLSDIKGVFTKGRNVKLSPYVLGQYEVTQALYEAVVGDNPSYFKNNAVNGEIQANRPVEEGNELEYCAFCNELTKLIFTADDCVYYSNPELTEIYTMEDAKTFVPDEYEEYAYHLKPVYMAYDYKECKWAKKGYRLPTEAEWEYAARGGNPNDACWSYSFSGTDTDIDSYNWYTQNAGGKTHEVGLKLKNNLNLYDMIGNVCEYCFDCYLEDPTEEDKLFFKAGMIQNPIPVYDIHYYMICRGGAFNTNLEEFNIENREGWIDISRNNGFRVCRSLIE